MLDRTAAITGPTLSLHGVPSNIRAVSPTIASI